MDSGWSLSRLQWTRMLVVTEKQQGVALSSRGHQSHRLHKHASLSRWLRHFLVSLSLLVLVVPANTREESFIISNHPPYTQPKKKKKPSKIDQYIFRTRTKPIPKKIFCQKPVKAFWHSMCLRPAGKLFGTRWRVGPAFNRRTRSESLQNRSVSQPTATLLELCPDRDNLVHSVPANLTGTALGTTTQGR